jgi:prophage antirepressor-like protein
MSNALVSYQFEENPVRIEVIAGTPWFVAGDVARALGYARQQEMSRNLDDDEKGVHNVHSLGGMQEMTVISESGLYAAILKSRKPQAKRFRRWVTGEVLPSIRKTGSYSASPVEATLPPRYWGTPLVYMFFRDHQIRAIGDATGRTFYSLHDIAAALGTTDLRELFRMVPQEYRAMASFDKRWPTIAVIDAGFEEMLLGCADELGMPEDLTREMAGWFKTVACARMTKENQLRKAPRFRPELLRPPNQTPALPHIAP